MTDHKISNLKKQVNFARPIFILLLVLVVIVCASVLKLTATFVIPVVIAILLSLVLEPILLVMHNKFRIPWLLGIFLILLFVFAGIAGFAGLFVKSLDSIISEYPKYEERFTTVYKELGGLFGLTFNEDFTLIENLLSQANIRQSLQGFAVSFSGNLVSLAKEIVLVLFFVVFFLLELKFLRKKLEIMFEDGNKEKVSSMITNVIEQTIRYLSVKFFISLTTGILVLLGTLFIGLDFPIIWGFIAFVLNFIPNFGSIISGVLTAGFALLQFYPNPTPVIFTVLLMLCVNLGLGNFVEPKIQGRELGLSPFVIIVSLSFWGWLWGFTGLVVGVPMMVILKIICENFSILHPLSILLGNYTGDENPVKNKNFNDGEKSDI